jgi:hypothetical protein
VGGRTPIDLSSTVSTNIDKRDKLSHKFQSSSATTGEFELPPTAALIFPGLDFVAAQKADDAAGFKNKMKRGKLFVDDYFDRRARSKFV